MQRGEDGVRGKSTKGDDGGKGHTGRERTGRRAEGAKNGRARKRGSNETRGRQHRRQRGGGGTEERTKEGDPNTTQTQSRAGFAKKQACVQIYTCYTHKIKTKMQRRLGLAPTHILRNSFQPANLVHLPKRRESPSTPACLRPQNSNEVNPARTLTETRTPTTPHRTDATTPEDQTSTQTQTRRHKPHTDMNRPDTTRTGHAQKQTPTHQRHDADTNHLRRTGTHSDSNIIEQKNNGRTYCFGS